MSKTLTLTIPDVLHRALEIKGAPYGREPGPFIKQFIEACSIGYEGPLLLKAAMDQAITETPPIAPQQADLLTGLNGGGSSSSAA